MIDLGYALLLTWRSGTSDPYLYFTGPTLYPACTLCRECPVTVWFVWVISWFFCVSKHYPWPTQGNKTWFVSQSQITCFKTYLINSQSGVFVLWWVSKVKFYHLGGYGYQMYCRSTCIVWWWVFNWCNFFLYLYTCIQKNAMYTFLACLF